ncbi:hypothetical protein EDEG_03412 [Edhazardia aedis USNM 41457]|uniref:Uncharacterized protein n=1 Tax=Edhazardia aedis (strain USNM 41457) TaxID=1003232 RepID=J9D3M8_EDHAE|nr:hypothetical protein EDEG_03412 [Edhazardia aedis USNM 41457]|eukprot:EJW02144.1 hypothetical protein EDEG_03412 [Edhazardia aedis USNM 41457]
MSILQYFRGILGIGMFPSKLCHTNIDRNIHHILLWSFLWFEIEYFNYCYRFYYLCYVKIGNTCMKTEIFLVILFLADLILISLIIWLPSFRVGKFYGLINNEFYYS